MDVKSLMVRLGFTTDTAPLEKVQEHLEGIEHKLSFLAAAEVIKGLYELAERFSGLGEQIETAAVSAGITAEAFQKLAFAASQNAVSQDELSGGLAKLNRNLFEAKRGGEQATKAFADVGITPEQLAGFQNSSQALRALSDRFATIKDPIQRQALAMELLGRGSYNMVKFLGKGSEAMDKLGDSAETMGAVITNEQVEALADLEDSLSGLFQIFKALGAQIGAMFAPTVKDIVQDIEAFYAANQKLIKQDLMRWIGDIAYGLGFLSGIVKDIVGLFAAFINAHPVLVENIAKVVLALGALSVATGITGTAVGLLLKGFGDVVGVVKLIPSLFTAMSTVGGGAVNVLVTSLGFFKGALGAIAFRLGAMLAGVFPGLSAALLSLNTLLVASPVGVFAAALAAAVLAGQALWTMLNGGKFTDTWLGMMLSKIMELPAGIMRVYEALKGKFFGASAPETASSETPAPASGLSAIAGNVQSMFGAAAPAMSAAQQMTMPNVATPAATLDFAADSGAGRGVNYTLNAPLTVNTSSALGPDQAYKAVKEAAGEHFDRQVRDLMRSTQTAVVH